MRIQTIRFAFVFDYIRIGIRIRQKYGYPTKSIRMVSVYVPFPSLPATNMRWTTVLGI
jgi:hypothetical protein